MRQLLCQIWMNYYVRHMAIMSLTFQMLCHEFENIFNSSIKHGELMKMEGQQSISIQKSGNWQDSKQNALAVGLSKNY